jgi:hypothetical protein
MPRASRIAVLLILVLVPGLAAAEPDVEDGVINEVLGILRERGIVDDQRYEELVARHHADQARRESLLDRIQWSGDVRARLENFWYDEDELGEDRSNRTRGRYRVRLGARAEINDWIAASFRLASGEDDHRSTNQTLGGEDGDFDPDSIFIDQAFLTVNPGGGRWLGEGSSLLADVGKVQNPFVGKVGKDFMLWDHDINPEGGVVRIRTKPSEAIGLYGNAGYFVIDENGTSTDAHVMGLQGGVEAEATEQVQLGGRMSFYAFRSLDMGFGERGADFGNVPDGLTDGNDKLSATELQGFVRWLGIEDWPVLLYGTWARNLDARSSDAFPEVGKEDDGFGVGLEVGDKKKLVQLGVGYWQLEANFWPAQYTDSDLFDGFTNRKGFAFYGAREILPGTELNLTLFMSDELEDDLPGFEESVGDADRLRLQTDLIVKF